MKTQRIASIWLPRLPIERWIKASGASDEDRVALVVEAAHGQLVHVSTAAAGVRRGTRLTDARALDPGLAAVAADVAGDAELLGRLARWASRWSPLVEIDGEDGLRMDVSGVAHLFGGEDGLVADIEARFAGLGLSIRVAIAGTAGAAWALARFPSPAREEGQDVLAPLPVAALRLAPAVVHTLNRLGLKTIGALAGVPRRSLARRFREAYKVLDALDRALGRTPEPLTATPFEPPPRGLLRLKEPVVHPEAAAQALALLVPGLVEQLAARTLGARRLHLAGYRVDGSIAEAGVATAIPSRDPAHLLRLLADKAAALDPGFGFDGFALEASWTEALGAAQDSLVEEPSGEADVARLVDRLSVKLGPDKVRRPVAVESYLPERASGWGDALTSLRAERSNPDKEMVTRSRKEREKISSSRLRDLRVINQDCRAPAGLARTATYPQRLLDRPEAIGVIYATPEGLPRRFVWRRMVHDVARAEGPERIAPEWWRSAKTARLRDYYRVEDREGRRYWIYREGLHGDGRGGDPVWYLHGLFG